MLQCFNLETGKNFYIAQYQNNTTVMQNEAVEHISHCTIEYRLLVVRSKYISKRSTYMDLIYIEHSDSFSY